MAVGTGTLRSKKDALMERLEGDIARLDDLKTAAGRRIREDIAPKVSAAKDAALQKAQEAFTRENVQRVASASAAAARTAGTAASAEARVLGRAAKNVGYAPVAAGGYALGAAGKAKDKVISAVGGHSVFLYVLIAVIIHVYDAALGFPRAQFFGLGIAGLTEGVKPASMIALAALLIAYSIFRQMFKEGAAIVFIGIVIYVLGILPIVDYMLQLYVWAAIALWLLAFNGLEGGREGELGMLVGIAVVSWAFPLIGLARPELLSGFGKFFLNPVVHLWLLYYGIIKFQKESGFAKFIAVMLVLGWLIVALALYASSNPVVIGGETISQKHYTTAAETLTVIKDATVKAVVGFVNAISGTTSKWVKTQIAEAAGLEEYPGEKQGQREGMELKLNPATGRKFDISTQKNIDVYATLEPVKRLQQPVKVTSVGCEMKKQESRGAIKGKALPDITGEGIVLVANEPLEISCSIPNSNLGVGTSTVKVSSAYTFETNAELRTYFMENERFIDEAGKLGSIEALATRYGLPATRIVAKHGDSPVKVGIGGIPEKAPVGISNDNKNTKISFIGVSLSNEKSLWRGKIARVNEVKLEVPEGVTLMQREGCAFEGSGTTYYAKKQLYEGITDIDDRLSFSCPAAIEDVASFIGEQPVAEKVFKVGAKYEYKTELEVGIEITKSKETVLTGQSGGSVTTVSMDLGDKTGSTFTTKASSKEPSSSCTNLPHQTAIETYENAELLKGSGPLKAAVKSTAEKYGIKPAFLAALSHEESAFNKESTCDDKYGTSTLTGCDLPNSDDCNINSKWTQSDEAQLECAAQTLRNGFNGESGYKDCLQYNDDDRWACVFCHYQGAGGISCPWNTKIRQFYCVWSAYYAKQEGLLT